MIKKVRLADFKPDNTTIQKDQITGVTEEFRRFLEEQFTDGADDDDAQGTLGRSHLRIFRIGSRRIRDALFTGLEREATRREWRGAVFQFEVSLCYPFSQSNEMGRTICCRPV
jgi:hypothetical protein